MNNLLIAFRTFFKRKNNATKIVLLSVGLSIGFILIAKIHFERSYESFFPDSERLYMVTSNVAIEENLVYSQKISGGVVVDINAEIPEIETSTRSTGLAHDDVFVLSDKRKLQGTFILADPMFFDLFPRKILAGDAKDVLSRPMYVMISSELAQKMGGAAVVTGLSLQLESAPGKTMTIGGVFEKLPQNTHLKYDVVVSMSSAAQFISDNPSDWNGAKRYTGYVKLYPGVNPENINRSIEKLHEKHAAGNLPGGDHAPVHYNLKTVQDIHLEDVAVKQNILLYLVFVLILLTVSIMNYSMSTVSSLVNRSKEIAILKCYGASEKEMYGKILSETVVDFLFSLLASAILLFAFHDTVFYLLETRVTDLFTWGSCLVLLFVSGAVILLCSLIPGYLYTKTTKPLRSHAFTENKRSWRLYMLFIQVLAANFFVLFLWLINKQYDYLITFDPGYNYANVVYCNMAGIPVDTRQRALDEVRRLPNVDKAVTATDLLFDKPKRNYVLLPDESQHLFQAADLYAVGSGFCELLEIPLLEGRSFDELGGTNEVMVSRRFATKLLNYVDWEEGVVGKSIQVTGHGEAANTLYTICGIYEDIHLGLVDKTPLEASMLFYSGKASHNLLIKLHRLTPEKLQEVAGLLAGLFPEKEVTVNSYTATLKRRYDDSRKFRDTVVLGGLVALLICLISLIEYTNNVAGARAKEIAIRKVNGATISAIVSFFIKGMLWIIVPAQAVGGIIAFVVSTAWLERFSEKTTVQLSEFFLCSAVLFVCLLSVIGSNFYRAAIENPSKVLSRNK